MNPLIINCQLSFKDAYKIVLTTRQSFNNFKQKCVNMCEYSLYESIGNRSMIIQF